MSLQVAAKHLASKGRNGDTMLVHMTPGEVRGLQALALAKGGSLSINPDTGLVEANFLKKMLPMIAGAALMATGVGAPLAAGLVGGFETMRTGDLGKGLMAGLGAYGGAGLVSGLSTAGASTMAPEFGATTVTEAGIPIAENTAKANIQNAFNLSQNATPIPGAVAPGSAAGSTITSSITPQAPVTLSNLKAGFSASPSAIYSALPQYTLPAAGMSLANAATPEQDMPSGEYTPDEYDKRLAAFRISPNFTGSTPVRPNPYYRPTGLGYAAQGGSTDDIMMAAGGAYDDEPMGDTQGMAMGGIASYANKGQVSYLPESVAIPRTGIFRDTDSDTARKDAYEATMIRNKKLAKASNIKLADMPKTSIKGLGDVVEAAGGGSLGGYSDGGRMLKGPGDGMSDSIPATIGRKQPARLADGEFVVPADVVSHLGNGSTDAGAKKLYSMMNKIRTARTGKKTQAKAVKADKYMPA
jgi:hypothetical protein